MYEVEMKLRADHEAVAAELDRLDAAHRGSFEQADVYFSAPHRDFAARDEALRLREETGAEGSESVLTYKGPRLEGDSKVRTEHETEIEAPEELTATLEALGFESAATVEKKRERYALDSVTVTLDAVSGLGEFVEIEARVKEGGLEHAREVVEKTAKRLGLEPAEQIETSYLELLLENGG